MTQHVTTASEAANEVEVTHASRSTALPAPSSPHSSPLSVAPHSYPHGAGADAGVTGPPGASARGPESAPTSLRVEGPAAPANDDSTALVGRAGKGDRAAFRALFDRHRHDVARLVYRMVGPRAEIEDLIQEVFVQVHRSLRDFRGEARFSTWLHRVTVNVVLMHRRAERSRPILAEEIMPGTVPDRNTAHPDDEAERRARIAAFFRVLDGISEKKRVVFVLHDLEGHSPAEIAELVDAPVLTVRTRLFYARRELEEKMQGDPLLAAIVREQGGFAGEPVDGPKRGSR